MHELSAVAAVLGRAAASGDGDGVRLVERMVAVLNTGGTEALAGLYSQGYVDHDPLPGQPPGLEGVRVGMESLARLGSDVRFHLNVEGRLRSHLYVDGEFHDIVIVGFDRDGWRGLDAFLSAWAPDTDDPL